MLRNLMLVGAAVVAASIGIPALHNADPDLLPGLADAALGRGAAQDVPELAMLASPAEVATSRRVRLEPDGRGHFIGDFRMNGRSVEAMIDTGASVVAINATTARRIGVTVSPADFRQSVNTANGTIKAAPATLSRLEIGGIVVRDVQAVVLDDKALSGTLIGMSFLNGLRRFQVEDGRLLLEQ
ncbi:MAG: TIGR02281 family clan AA aspartic protease [Rhizobiaceae bacterium]|nr:TIGR02281 family clan AA aspartic protease [Rhizobiaceae bacterium]